MIRALQVLAVFAFLLIMLGINRGAAFLFHSMGTEFTAGALFGGFFVGGIVALCLWLEPVSPRRQEPGALGAGRREQKGADYIDL
ncbi:MAG: hypothetical protein BGN85_09445 [Alphaproteobacteria bacterium 64-11]|jgi:hypothetical protein|nr:MAG: hypothetical protein BGN85_09445 [Alphaproteobacteria bacterium 64-11]